MPDEHRFLTEPVEEWQNLINGRLAAQYVLGNAVDVDRLTRQWAPGIHQLFEGLVLEQPPVNDAGGADLDDLVPLRGLQPVVSVSNTVKVSCVSSRSSRARLSSVCRNRSKS